MIANTWNVFNQKKIMLFTGRFKLFPSFEVGGAYGERDHQFWRTMHLLWWLQSWFRISYLIAGACVSVMFPERINRGRRSEIPPHGLKVYTKSKGEIQEGQQSHDIPFNNAMNSSSLTCPSHHDVLNPTKPWAEEGVSSFTLFLWSVWPQWWQHQNTWVLTQKDVQLTF